METGTQGNGIMQNGQGNSGTLRQHIESEITTPASAAPIFRSDLLDYSPIAKSGYLFFENDHDEDLDDGMALAWLKCLKKHPDYKDLYIQEDADIVDIYDLLHKETNRLCGKYSWVFTNECKTPHILFYQSMGEIKTWNVPVEFFFTHHNSSFQSAAMYLIKHVAEAFKIQIIYNDTMESIISNEHEEDPETLIVYLKQSYTTGDKSEDPMLYAMVADYLDYIRGDIRKMAALIQKMGLSKEGFFQHAEECRQLPESYYKWLMDGITLLDNPCNIYDFHLTPYNLSGEGEDVLYIDAGIFFPWKFSGYVFEHYEEWLNDTAQNGGTNDVYNHGLLTANKYVPPNDPEPMMKLFKWLDDGREIFFNETDKPKRTEDIWKSEIMTTNHSSHDIF